MASAAYNNNDTDAGMHPGRLQRPQMPPSSTAASDNNGSDSDSDIDLFRLSLNLGVAERQNIDLELDNQRLQSALETVKALNRSLEQDKAIRTITTSEDKALRTHIGVLESDLEKKAAELADATDAAREALRERDEIQNSREHLIAENNALEAALYEADARSGDVTDSQACIADLQRKLAAEQDKVAALANVNTQLTQRLVASQADAEFSKARLVNIEAELAEARTSTDRNSLRPGITQTRASTNVQAAEHPTFSDRVENEHADSEPENEVNILKDKVADPRWNALEYIIGLDLANRNFRGFDCEHGNVREIPDGRNSSCGPTAGRVAEQIFRDWHGDEQFLRGYTTRRQKLIKHHKAHFRVQEGNGVRFWLLRDEFNSLDADRGLDVTYT